MIKKPKNEKEQEKDTSTLYIQYKVYLQQAGHFLYVALRTPPLYCPLVALLQCKGHFTYETESP